MLILLATVAVFVLALLGLLVHWSPGRPAPLVDASREAVEVYYAAAFAGRAADPARLAALDRRLADAERTPGVRS